MKSLFQLMAIVVVLMIGTAAKAAERTVAQKLHACGLNLGLSLDDIFTKTKTADMVFQGTSDGKTGYFIYGSNGMFFLPMDKRVLNSNSPIKLFTQLPGEKALLAIERYENDDKAMEIHSSRVPASEENVREFGETGWTKMEVVNANDQRAAALLRDKIVEATLDLYKGAILTRNIAKVSEDKAVMEALSKLDPKAMVQNYTKFYLENSVPAMFKERTDLVNLLTKNFADCLSKPDDSLIDPAMKGAIALLKQSAEIDAKIKGPVMQHLTQNMFKDIDETVKKRAPKTLAGLDARFEGYILQTIKNEQNNLSAPAESPAGQRNIASGPETGNRTH